MGRIARFTWIACGVLLAIAGFVLTGCEQANSPVERKEQGEGVLAYDITSESDFVDAGLSVKRYAVSTAATSGEDLEGITADLWEKTSGYQVVQVVFYPENSAADDTSGAGSAFENEQVARTALTEASTREADVEERVREAMENDGIYVISMADEQQEGREG